MSDTERFFTLESANADNRLAEVAAAAGHPVVALCDEDYGGVIAYMLPAHADDICSALNDTSEMP